MSGATPVPRTVATVTVRTDDRSPGTVADAVLASLPAATAAGEPPLGAARAEVAGPARTAAGGTVPWPP